MDPLPAYVPLRLQFGLRTYSPGMLPCTPDVCFSPLSDLERIGIGFDLTVLWVLFLSLLLDRHSSALED